MAGSKVKTFVEFGIYHGLESGHWLFWKPVFYLFDKKVGDGETILGYLAEH